MSYETFIALRYLASSRKRAHVALISTISILGLAVGVAALIISLALLSGFQDKIRAQMALRSPHLVVSPVRGDRLDDPQLVARTLAALPGVLSAGPVIEGRGWLCDSSGRNGVPVRYRNVSEGPLRLSGEGAPPARVSSAAASRIGAETGGLLRVLSSRSRLSPLGPIPIAVLVRVAAIRRGSALEKAADLEVPEPTARLLAGLASGAQAYEARLSDPNSADAAARIASVRLPAAYRVRTWRELNAPLSFALRLEKSVIFATIALVIVVAALNVVSNIALLVVEKKRDLGVLVSLGALPGSLAKIYLTLGGVIGGLGTVAGILVGVVASLLLDRFHVVPLPADVYLLSHVPFAVHPREVFLVTLFALATAVAAAVLPARAAARIAPGEAIRLSR
ncbi:MAG TPA: FtsX-like permease family protein [Thermoanaerobaculia bacterium]|nr:FtsX-like permease family protein [Thermoanaerobaculia bacterium]